MFKVITIVVVLVIVISVMVQDDLIISSFVKGEIIKVVFNQMV